MSQSRTPRPRRPRYSADTSRRLEQARLRNAQQLADQRRREHQVDTALTTYITAQDTITQAEQDRAQRIAPLQDRINHIRTETEHRITTEHTRQAHAALAIHEAGRTLKQVAQLLDLPEPETRTLLTTARTTPPTSPPAANSPSRAPTPDIE